MCVITAKVQSRSLRVQKCEHERFYSASDDPNGCGRREFRSVERSVFVQTIELGLTANPALAADNVIDRLLEL